MGVHSKYSPSGAKRWLSCTASIQQCECEGKESESSSYALEGSALHKICEIMLSEGEKPTLESFIGQRIYGVEIDAEHIEAVRTALSELEALMVGKNYFSKLPEMERDLDAYGYHQVFGTVDFVAGELFGELLVADFKFGKGIQVFADNNVQMMIYALAAIENDFDRYTNVKMAIIQPRLLGNDNPTNVFEMKPEELRSWANEVLFPTVDAIERGEGVFAPSDENCQWCDGKAECKALAEVCIETAKLDFVGVETKKDLADRAEETDVNRLSKILKIRKLTKNWLEAVEAKAKNIIEEGGDVPGFKLVHGNSIRKWAKDDDDIFKKFKSWKFTKKDMYAEKFSSPAEAEKLLKARKPEVLKKFEKLVLKSFGAPTLVESTDKREAIVFSSAESDFENVVL